MPEVQSGFRKTESNDKKGNVEQNQRNEAIESTSETGMKRGQEEEKRQRGKGRQGPRTRQ